MIRMQMWHSCSLPADFFPSAPHVWAPRKSAWSPPSPGVCRRPDGPDEGCCCGCGWTSDPPSFQQWGTWVSAVVQLLWGFCHSSYQKQTRYMEPFYLTWNYNNLSHIYSFNIDRIYAQMTVKADDRWWMLTTNKLLKLRHKTVTLTEQLLLIFQV